MSNSPKLVTRIAQRFGVDEGKFWSTLKATAFKQSDGSAPTDEQMMTLLIVAEQYQLNPFTKEIYAFPDKKNGIVPVVGVDGWSRIINTHPQFDGMEFEFSETMVTMAGAKAPAPEWIECVMYRKDRSRPVRIREYLDETYRAPFKGTGRNGAYTVDGPWQTHPKRFLRHKSMIQGSRVAFGFTGIYDQDEAERISEVDITSFGSHSVNGNVQAESHSRQPLAITHQEQQQMQPILDALVKRAKEQNAWAASQQWVQDKYQGAPHMAEFAVQYLRDEEIASMPHAHQSEQEDTNQATAEVVEAETTTKAVKASNASKQAPEQRQVAETSPSDMFPSPADQFPEDDNGPGF